MEWLHWQIGSLGPMLGQLGYFAKRAEEKTPAAIARFTEEGERLLGVIERQLAQSRYLAGDAYSIADMAAYPWMVAATTFLEEPLAHVLAGEAFHGKMVAGSRSATGGAKGDAGTPGLSLRHFFNGLPDREREPAEIVYWFSRSAVVKSRYGNLRRHINAMTEY